MNGNISSPVRYSYLWILPDDEADTLAAYLLKSYCSFSFLMWSLVVIFYYMYSKRFFLNFKGLSDANVVSLTKKEYGTTVYFLWMLTKFSLLISDEWFIAICWSSLLRKIFVIKNDFNVKPLQLSSMIG